MKQYIIFSIVALLVVGAAVMYTKKAPENGSPAGATTTEVGAVESGSGTVVINPKPITMANGLIIEDVKIGTGAEAVKGALISVHYVGTLTNGTKFDSSRDRGEPFQFPLGQGMVIQGWEQGFEGMKVGGVRKLTIPPQLGYGSQAMGPIPANSTLQFEVELFGVRLK